MLKRRLYLQIYLTIIASLILVVLMAAAVWGLTRPDRPDRYGLEMISRLVSLSLEEAGAPIQDQQAAVARLAAELEVSVSLFSPDRALVARHGVELPPPPTEMTESGWRRRKQSPGWYLLLPDGRWVAASKERAWPGPPLLGAVLFLGVIALGIGIGAYPFVRRLTRRLERLQAGVEHIATGDLSARVAVTGRDEVAALGASFNEAAAKIEALVTANRMLLANASHELRTPLSRIRLGVEMLKQGRDPAREEALQQDILELDELIEEILMMSRLDAGTQDDSIADVDLTALAAEECARYPDCRLQGDAGAIAGDPRLLRRMLRNLLENAHVHGAPPVSVTLSRAGSVAEIAVADAGPGIAADQREQVFEPFYRAPGRQNLRGFGLGLALVRQIAERHGGTAAIEDRAGGGTVVRVTLLAGPG